MAEGITFVCCAFILGLGVFCFFALRDSRRRFSEILRTVRAARQEVSEVGQVLEPDFSIEEKMTIRTTFDNVKLESARTEFDKMYSEYVCWSQMVPLFSSLGLLGTVLGLILSSSGDIQIDTLMSSLSLAMWTTLVGLICTIVLKVVDAVGPGRVINDIDAAFERVNEKMSRELYKRAGSSMLR
ncbi:MAG: MotA/TolQ/ExbB proton channel family protein [Lachnospiraceae bacterium]|nr:MotA/TolQ/ExbB proton channel family protein [Lachnospiraceae bacterium]